MLIGRTIDTFAGEWFIHDPDDCVSGREYCDSVLKKAHMRNVSLLPLRETDEFERKGIRLNEQKR